MKSVDQKRKSKSVLKKLLVLATRVLAFTFLVLAFARPSIHSESQQTNSDLIVYLDNSLSMQQLDESGEPLAYNGFEIVNALISNQDGVGQLRVIDNNRSRVISDPKDVQQINYSKRGIGLDILNFKTDQYISDELLVISDFQKSVFDLDEIAFDTSRNVTLIKIDGVDHANLYIDSVYLEKPPQMVGDNSINIKIKNVGGLEISEVPLTLYKDELQLAAITVNLNPQSSKTINIPVGSNMKLAGDYRIILEDYPIVFDNAYYFSIRNSSKPKVVVVSSQQRVSYFETVFANQEQFDLVSSSVENASFNEIINSDLLVLDGLYNIPDWLISQESQIQGKILVVPSDTIDTESYISLLGFRISQKTDISEGVVSNESLNHPLFEGILKTRSSMNNMPVARVVYASAGFKESLLKTNIGDGFLIKSGQREMYFLASPLADLFTNFHKHALFVPTLYRLAQSQQGNTLAYRMDGNQIEIAADSINAETILTLGNKVQSFIPSYSYRNGKIFIDIPAVLDQPGHYFLTSESDTLATIALNFDTKESETLSYSDEEIQRSIQGYPNVSLITLSNTDSYISSNIETGEKTPLWKYALVLALMFLFAESLILRYAR